LILIIVKPLSYPGHISIKFVAKCFIIPQNRIGCGIKGDAALLSDLTQSHCLVMTPRCSLYIRKTIPLPETRHRKWIGHDRKRT
jgi:hypothetical protein